MNLMDFLLTFVEYFIIYNGSSSSFLIRNSIMVHDVLNFVTNRDRFFTH